MKVRPLIKEEPKNDYSLGNTAHENSDDTEYIHLPLECTIQVNDDENFNVDKKLFSCDSCEKTFIQKSDLLRHSRTHTGEKPFKCEICKKSFSLKGTLNTHMVVHTGQRPFTCDICNKPCRDRSDLNRHNKSAAHLKLLEIVKNTTTSSNFIDCGVMVIKEDIDEMEENTEENTSADETMINEYISLPIECNIQVNEKENSSEEDSNAVGDCNVVENEKLSKENNDLKPMAKEQVETENSYIK